MWGGVGGGLREPPGPEALEVRVRIWAFILNAEGSPGRPLSRGKIGIY